MSHSVIVYDLTTGEIFYSNTEHLLYLLFGFLAFSRLEKCFANFMTFSRILQHSVWSLFKGRDEKERSGQICLLTLIPGM